MRHLLLISILTLSLFSNAQIDDTRFIIGRNIGTMQLHDGATTRIFGFAESLSANIEIPGPTLHFTEGDSVMIDFLNLSQGAPHTIHLHGLDVNQANDGVPSLSYQVNHSEHGYYKFKAPHAGTYLYHCHVVSTIHTQAGMYGVIIIHPPAGNDYLTWAGGEHYDRDFVYNTSEIDTFWHKDAILNHVYDVANPQPVHVPDVFAPQYFLINGKSDAQLSDPSNYSYALANDTVYTRLVNIGYYGVRYIFPSTVNARTISSDGRPLPSSEISDTVEVFPGERYGTMIQLGSDPQYAIQVEYFDLNTQVVHSTQTQIIQTSLVGIEENNQESIVFFPNPSNDGQFICSISFDENYTVYNSLGRIIIQSDSPTIDLSKFSDGIYFINYKGNTSKLIKQ